MIRDPVLLDDWHPVARSEDLDHEKVLKARLLGEDLVLWRFKEQPLAWKDLCIHRGSRLSLGRVDGDNLMCSYHGWTYNGEGQCVRIPAHPGHIPPSRAKVVTYRARERYGLIWASLGNPQRDIAGFDEWYDPAYRKIFCGPYTYNASGPRAVENFLDVAHFPFVHSGILGDSRRPEIQDYEVEADSEGIVARDIKVFQPDPDGTGRGSIVNYTYRTLRPLMAYFVKNSNGNRFSMLLAVTPVEEVKSIAWMWIAMNYSHDIPDEEIRRFQDRIVYQDIPVVESQRPELLPLDLQAELHLRSDRTSIAYRKWLKQLGLTFGTS